MASENDTSILFLVIPIFLVSFSALWLSVCALLSWISGWHSLGQEYRCHVTFAGPLWSWQTGHMRGVGFRNCLTVGADRGGLYLANALPFRFRHPPLYIPWSHIQVTPKRGLFIPGMQFLLGPAPGVPLWLSTKLAEKVRQAST
jgi:hypothetical protein